jgi:hypothetical protein
MVGKKWPLTLPSLLLDSPRPANHAMVLLTCLSPVRSLNVLLSTICLNPLSHQQRSLVNESHHKANWWIPTRTPTKSYNSLLPNRWTDVVVLIYHRQLLHQPRERRKWRCVMSRNGEQTAIKGFYGSIPLWNRPIVSYLVNQRTTYDDIVIRPAAPLSLSMPLYLTLCTYLPPLSPAIYFSLPVEPHVCTYN